MATVNFLYRSTKYDSYLNLRLLFRHDQQDFTIGVKTKLLVEKEYWKKYHFASRLRDHEIVKMRDKVNTELSNIRNHILDQFNETPTYKINKDWLNEQINDYYEPRLSKREIPLDLVSFIDYYVEERKKDNIKKASITKFNVIKHKVQRMEKFYNTTYLIKKIDESFKEDFANYYIEESYSQNTTQREFNIIKTFCRFAESKGLEISPSLRTLKFPKGEVLKVYLNKKELLKIEKLKNLPLYLENARDWLLISCWTGQRISDFMRFESKMVGLDEISGNTTIQFVQQKTGKPMNMPLGPKTLELLDKRNGEFPKKISSQKYNDYIKTICKMANIDQPTKGNIQKNISEDPNCKKNRNVQGTYPKYKLVGSKIGRRSFATNKYTNMPTSYIIYFTGHSSETMLLNYISKSNKDLAIEGAKYLD